MKNPWLIYLIIVIIIILVIYYATKRKSSTTDIIPVQNPQFVNGLIHNFDVKKFEGKWFEIARLPVKFEKDCVNSIGEYKLMGNSTDFKLSIHNKCMIDNKIIEEVGSARPLGSNHNYLMDQAVFALSFDGKTEGLFKVIYINNEYNIAMIGSNNLNELWIISKSPQIDPDNIQYLIQLGKQLGYDTTKLIFTQFMK